MSSALSEKQIRHNVGVNCRRLRGRRVTQEQLAEKCYCEEWMPNSISINRIENGAYGLKLFTAYRIAVALGVKLSDLLADPPSEIPDDAPKKKSAKAKKRGKTRQKKSKKSRVDRLAGNDKLSRSDEFDDL